MKMILQKNISLIMLVVLIVVVGCATNTTEQANIAASETPTITSTKTVIATPTLEHTFRTPVPTLSIDMEQKVVESLKSSECNLPCYMGIVPGKTKVEDAILMLESVGAISFGQTVTGNITKIVYNIKLDDPLLETFEPAYKDSKNVFNDLGLIGVDGIVQQIRIWVLAHGFSPKAQEYWSRYTPKGIFIQIGVPDEIYSSGGLLALVYKELGIINMYETFWKDGQLCPQNETYYFDRRFEITNPNPPIEILSEHQKSLKYVWKPIEESLGVSVQEFYDQVLTDDSICFDIKTE